MLSFLSLERLRSNGKLLEKAVAHAHKSRPPKDSEESSSTIDYFEALNVVQHVSLPIPQGRWPEIYLAAGDPRAQELLGAFDMSMNWCDQAPGEQLEQVRAHMTSALAQLDSVALSTANECSALVSHLVAAVVFSGEFTGGGMSESHHLGLVCMGMGPRRADMTTHFAETLLHESTHQALFLEDMLHRVFTDKARARVTDHPLQAYSTTRQTTRPYDVAFHGACVTATLEDYRGCLRSKSTATAENVGALRDLECSVQDLRRGASGALTDVGRAILEELERKVSSRFGFPDAAIDAN